MKIGEPDILTIDAEIQQKFQEESEKLSEYKIKLLELEEYAKIKNLQQHIYKDIESNCDDLRKKIKEIESNTKQNFYIVESTVLIDKYKKILQTPIKLNFVGKPIKNDKEKQKIIAEYLEIAQKYIDLKIDTTPSKKNKVICDNCNNKKDFDIVDGNTYICLNCSSQQVIIKHISSYKDINRVNISSKYTYDRKIHFRDCINQYQGKQNSTVEQKVYDDLEDQFERHHLLIGDKNTPKEKRFKRITKDHIMLFLKDLDYTKHYENINLVHYNLTGKKPDDIGYLEEKLLDDFDALTELYDKKFKNIDRKNFINTQYVLYQLLQRHKHPCKKEDFSILKTTDRTAFHDDICGVLFSSLGWNIISIL